MIVNNSKQTNTTGIQNKNLVYIVQEPALNLYTLKMSVITTFKGFCITNFKLPQHFRIVEDF